MRIKAKRAAVAAVAAADANNQRRHRNGRHTAPAPPTPQAPQEPPEPQEPPGPTGLAAALECLLQTVQRPTTLKAAGLPRFRAHVESCVSFCLATLLRDWPAGEARVLISVSAQDGRLGVVLFDPEASDFSYVATTADWQVVANRIAALNGTLAASPNFGGLIITIDIPATGLGSLPHRR